AEKLAEQGYVTLAFDASYQGESEGAPRYMEEPAARGGDIRSAGDYLTTLSYIDEERIGVLGVCAGGGYAVNAAMTERRIKAV
ncbi:dienelactone hydrolase family protein, partial [Acinetobacter baumannii]